MREPISTDEINRENDARQGTLIYIKPAFYRDEPTDVLNYGLRNREFPHETTADQFFDESQFESYRMLGLHIIEEIFKDENGAPDIERGLKLGEFQTQVKSYLKRGRDTIQRDTENLMFDSFLALCFQQFSASIWAE